MGRQESAGTDQDSEGCCAEELREVPEWAGWATWAQDHSQPKAQAWWDQPCTEGPGFLPSPWPQKAQLPLPTPLGPRAKTISALIPKFLQYVRDYLPLLMYSSQLRKQTQKGQGLGYSLTTMKWHSWAWNSGLWTNNLFCILLGITH